MMTKHILSLFSLGWEDSPGEGSGNPLWYSCLENPMNRGTWLAGYSPWDRKESDTTEQLSLSLSFVLAKLFFPSNQ